MARAAEEMDLARVRLGMIFDQSPHMGLPKFALLGGKRSDIEQMTVHVRQLGVANSQARLEPRPFPPEELALCGLIEVDEIICPIKDISKKASPPEGSPLDAVIP